MKKRTTTIKTQFDGCYIKTRIPKSPSLQELSISQIQQLKPNHDSIDFQQERDLISDFIIKVDQSAKQYGLKQFSKKSNNKDPGLIESSRLKKSPNQNQEYSYKSYSRKHQQLFFNHQKKRKFSAKKYNINQRFQNADLRRCLQKSNSTQKGFLKNKLIKWSLMSLCPVVPPLNNYFRKKQIKPVLQQKPLNLNINNCGQKNFLKLYHLRQDQFKKQLGDLNVNLNVNESFQQRNKAISVQHFDNRLQNCLKNQYQEITFHHNSNTNLSNSEDRQIQVANCYYRQGALQNSINEKPRTFQLRRPLTSDLRTITKQSPFSRDSSTGTQKTVKKPPRFSLGDKNNKIQSSFRKQTKNGQIYTHNFNF